MEKVYIRKMTDFMIGGCNVCPIVKTDMYTIELNGNERPLDELDVMSLITVVVLSNGYKQHQEYGVAEDYDEYKKGKNQVTIIPKHNQLLIKKGDTKEKIPNTYKNNQELFSAVNQLLTKYFDIKPLGFKIII